MLRLYPRTVTAISAAQADAFIEDTITSLGDNVVLPLGGRSGVAVQISGTWTGFLFAAISIDGGVTYDEIQTFDVDAKTMLDPSIIDSNGIQLVPNISGATHLKVQANIAWTGTATVRIRATQSPFAIPPATSAPTQPISSLTPVGGLDVDTQLAQMLNMRASEPLSTNMGLLVRLIAGTAYPVRISTARTVVGVYSHTLVEQAGVAAANNFYSVFNPAASGRIVAIKFLYYIAYAVAITISKVSKRVYRTSAASGGTLIPAADIFKHDPAFVNPTTEIRTGNPAATLSPATAQAGHAFPPVVVITAVGGPFQPSFERGVPRENEEIILPAGSGIVIRQTAAGDVDETMNIGVTIMEFT